MPSWKKIITSTDGPDSIDGVASSANKDNATQNHVLTFDGSDWVSATPGSTFNFQWTSVDYNLDATAEDADITDTTPDNGISKSILMGSGTCSANLTCTIVAANAALDSNLSDFKVELKEGSGAYADVISGTPTTLTATTCANSTSSLGMDFPASITSTNKLKCTWTHSNAGSQSNEYTISFGNYQRLGLDSDDTLSSGEINNLTAYKKLAGSGTGGTNQNAFGIPLGVASKYVHFAYPSRCTQDPSFSVGPTATSLSSETWVEQDGTVSVTNDEGYQETYKCFRSPTQLNNLNGVNTWFVAVTF